MRHLTSGALLVLDAQDVAGLGRLLDDAYPREVLDAMTDDELRRALGLVSAGRHRLELLERRVKRARAAR